MSDSMMSPSERERYNRVRQEARAHAQTQNSAIAVALAFSKMLRRLWVWGTLAVVVLASLFLLLKGANVISADNGFLTLVTYGIVFILPLWILWAFDIWCKAYFIRWAARKAQRDYRDDELFNR